MKPPGLLLLLFLLASLQRASASGHLEEFNSVGQQHYNFTVSTGEPDRWDSSAEEFPPLSPKKAIEIARRFMQEAPRERGSRSWEFSRVTLEKLSSQPEEWVYRVTFSPRSGGPQNEFRVIVRLNGTLASLNRQPR